MRSSRVALVLSCLLGCATPGARAPSSGQTQAKPADELASAFEPDSAPPPPRVVARQPPPLPDLRAPFRGAAERTTRALAQRDVEAAQAALTDVEREAQALGFAERTQAAELAFKVAVVAGAPTGAAARARAWLMACAIDAVDTCRAAALNALLSTGRLDPATTRQRQEEVAGLQRAERCVQSAERLERAEKCLPEAEALARATSDAFLKARAELARALAAPEPRQAALLAQLEASCTEPACLPVRRKALARLLARARAEKRTLDVARLTLKDAHAAGAALPASERRWSRPPETDAACAALDAANGAGACRRLEKELLGSWTFRDFSKSPPREGLTREQVVTVNEHYAPLLQECLAAQARRLTPPDSAHYELRWMVFNDGRVGEVHFKQPALDDSELASCLRSQFEAWRYPRYDGEWQHVEQGFTITAAERRSAR
ncbi:MAG: hypothetical protein INH41_16185 [Myxococcaceae bacterium]|jgi:hypothetical protein|nr:hypothetical protein [Myxococcaceae bacterium]MCA3013920.1 hypothetical protein [Myxococcaceae bacterium]